MTDTIPTRDDLPAALVAESQWICWRDQKRDGKSTKVPIDPATEEYASTTDPETWAAFETAVEAATTSDVTGIGFVFAEDDPFVGVDLDDCREPTSGTTEQWATAIIEQLDSYTEISPSGTGYHVLVRGTLPEGRNRRGEIELYETARFFTVTGDRVGGQQTLRERTDALATIYDEYIRSDDSSRTLESDRSAESPMSAASPRHDSPALPDEDLLARARNAANGEKFQRLWRGDTSGYDSHSEADMALCCLLAFWTGGDRVQLDRLFRQSGLMRAKWDEVHYADGATYGEKTVQRAIARTSESYDPPPESDSADRSTVHDQPAAETSTTTPSGTTRKLRDLLEQHRTLEQQVEELEALVDEQADRIAVLETRLRTVASGTSHELSSPPPASSDSASSTDSTATAAEPEDSLVDRAKRFVGRDAE